MRCIARFVQRFLKQLAGRFVAPGKQQLGHFTLQNILPELAPLVGIAEALLDPGAETFHQCRQAAVRGRHVALQACAQQARQHWRCSAAGHCNLYRRAVDNRRHDKTAQVRLVNHVDRKIRHVSKLGYTTIHVLLVGACNNQHLAFYIAILKLPRTAGDPVLLEQRGQFTTQFGSDHFHPGAGTHQQGNLARSNLTPTDHQAITVIQL